MKRKASIILIVAAVIAAVACLFPGIVIAFGMWTDNIRFHTYPAPNLAGNAPLEEFVLGEWQYKGPYSYEGIPYPDAVWQFEFHDTDFDPKLDADAPPGKLLRLRFRVEGSQKIGGFFACAYRFVESDLIETHCQRLKEGRLSVKRDGEQLVVQWVQWAAGAEALMPLKLTRCHRLLWSNYYDRCG